MDYRDELKKNALKKQKYNQINKVVILIIFLILVLAAMHFINKKKDSLVLPNTQKDVPTQNENYNK